MTKNVVVIGTQWGDEGKGKLVDLLTDKADAVVRSRWTQCGSYVGYFWGNDRATLNSFWRVKRERSMFDW